MIFSAGPDKIAGLRNKSQLSYAAYNVNPFCLPDLADPMFPTPSMVGSTPITPISEPGWYNGCWLDNIHNHALSIR